jgi:hypothetical protein
MIFSVGKFANDNANIDALTIKNDGNVGIGTASPSNTLEITNQGGTFNLGGSLRNVYQSLGLSAASITPGYNTASGPTNNGDGSYTWTKGGGDTNGVIALGFTASAYEQLKITFTAKTTDTTSPTFQFENPNFTSMYSNTLSTTYTTYTFYVTIPSNPMSVIAYFRVYADDITWNAFTVERANVLNGGYVGIGTADPTSKLHVFGGALTADTDLATFHYTNGNQSLLKIRQVNHTPANTDWTGWSTRIQQVTDVTNQSYIEFNPVDGQYATAFGMGGAEYMRIKNGGNVGIGTVSPRQKLEVANGHIAIVRNSWKSEAADDQLAGKIDFHLGGDAGQLATPVAAIEAYDKFQTGSSYGGVLAFKTLGTERMRILENGNVGIGTTSPAYTLDVNGLASSKTRRVFEFSGGDNYARHFWICSFLDAAGYHTNQLIKINYSVTYKRLTGTHSRNSLASGTVTLSNLWRYSTNATAGEYQYVTLQDQKNEQYTGQGRLPKWYYVRFNNRGYLVLCTSISSGDSSSYYVKGNVEFLTRPTAESADYVWNGTIYNDSSIAQTEGFTSISNLYPTTGTSEDGWDTTMTSGSTAQNFIEATEGTAFKYGNVGIGTTAPQTKFDVRSKALIGEYNSGGFYNANGRLHVRGNTNTPIILEKIGIITSGIGNFSGGMGLSTQGGAVDFRVAGAFNGDLGVSGSHVARFSNGGDRLQIYRDVNGSSPYFYYNSGGNYGTYSDRRGKKNIQTLNVSESVQYVKNLNPVSFNYYTETSDVTPQAGFIAQEVLEAETNPSQTKCVINGHETYDPDDVNSPNLGVGMQSMIPMLVQALQNALERIEALENNA